MCVIMNSVYSLITFGATYKYYHYNIFEAFFFFLPFISLYDFQNGSAVPNGEISQREKARLKEMQRLKKQKVQEILDAQNAAIEADMVRCLGKYMMLAPSLISLIGWVVL